MRIPTIYSMRKDQALAVALVDNWLGASKCENGIKEIKK